ncbi:MAG: inositol monophosphatase family protein [Acidobacteria bacterium]|nr:inositol monophosphatase family protein [Acidobacteriota bacterium]
MSHDPRYLATAVDIVLRAGAIQMASFQRDFAVSKKGSIDLVTEVDLAVERMCREVLAERFPSHGVLAEEMGQSAGDDPEYCWLFDPIDGTTNYAHGMPVFCSALALEINGRVEVSAVYDPTRRELFTAERGQGAYLNGLRMQVSSVERLVDAVLVTGFPYDVHQNPDDILGLFGAFLTRAQAVRRLGSAALDLCYVAAGRLDGFWEDRLKPWDIAAATLLVEEAGGHVTGMDGGGFNARLGHVLATNGPLHAAMLSTILEYFERKSSRNRTS